jgi:hypothetical protein
MTDKHSYPFFGTDSGIILQSSSKDQDYIFLTCLKKKADGSWEKLKKREGKIIKCGLEEMVMILRVLTNQSPSWSTVHNFKEDKTQISFNWGEDKNKEKILWISIGSYKKLLRISQIEIFRLLLDHLLKEKIESATGSTTNSLQTYVKQTITPEIIPEDLFENTDENKLVVVEQIQKENDTSSIKGMITNETEKALLLMFNGGMEVWIPKSLIHSKYKPESTTTQSFTIETWILKKNKIIT